LQTVPPYIVGAFFTLFFPYLAMKFKRRGVIMMCASPMIVVGYIMYLASYE
jgi:MFS-type transporter involved in bile tolerance (Atg22 family)